MVEALPESLKPIYFIEREIFYEENCCYCYIIATSDDTRLQIFVDFHQICETFSAL